MPCAPIFLTIIFADSLRRSCLRYRDFYKKEPGTVASLQGQLYVDSEGHHALQSWKLRVEEFRAEVP